MLSMSRHEGKVAIRDYDRQMMRSAIVSLFWNVISDRRKRSEITLNAIAVKLKINKSAVSRWFSGDKPNWTMDTVSDLAGALDLEIVVEAIDRKAGVVYTSNGEVRPLVSSSTEVIIENGAFGLSRTSSTERFHPAIGSPSTTSSGAFRTRAA